MKKPVLVLVILLWGNILQALDVKDIINNTVRTYEHLKTFSAEFNQVLCDGVSGACTNFEGTIYFLEPNFFRMEIKEPHQIYVGDSVSLWIYLPQEKRAIRQNLRQMPFAINPDIFLKDYEKNFVAELVREENDFYEVALTPKEESEIYKRITVMIDNKKFEIHSIAVLDETGSENKFVFENIALNKHMSRKLFQFKPPAGITIDEY